MDNLEYFPTIAHLIIQIEGSDEDHAQRAWDALRGLPNVGHKSTIHLTDHVMAKTMIDMWLDWPEACRALSDIPNEIERNIVRKSFKTSYIENYKKREKIRIDMPGDTVILPGTKIDPCGIYNDETVCDYIVKDYKIELLSKHTIKALLPEGAGPMPPEMKEKFREMMEKLGKPVDNPPKTKSFNPFLNTPFLRIVRDEENKSDGEDNPEVSITK